MDSLRLDLAPPTGRVRRSRCLVMYLDDGVVGFNFMSRTATRLDLVDLSILLHATDWTTPAAIDEAMGSPLGDPDIAARRDALVAAGALVAEGTDCANRDIEYEQRFVWGLGAAHFHFSIRDPIYMAPDAMAQWLVERVETTPRVPLFLTNEGADDVVQLDPPSDDGFFDVLHRRRSYRGFSSDPLSLQELADCLFAGFGITGFVGAGTIGEGRLPIGMTPSAGARNPYEGYVYARNVADLEPGAYHYSAVEHSLALVTDTDLPTIGRVLADQPWFDDAAALVLLVANFDRTMWKYPHPTGYRVVLLEAGHIAQNILLTATDRGLAAAPTCALSDREAERLLGLRSVVTSVVYTVALGHRGDDRSCADIVEHEPNPLLG